MLDPVAYWHRYKQLDRFKYENQGGHCERVYREPLQARSGEWEWWHACEEDQSDAPDQVVR